jgi:hypothetical protein
MRAVIDGKPWWLQSRWRHSFNSHAQVTVGVLQGRCIKLEGSQMAPKPLTWETIDDIEGPASSSCLSNFSFLAHASAGALRMVMARELQKMSGEGKGEFQRLADIRSRWWNIENLGYDAALQNSLSPRQDGRCGRGRRGDNELLPKHFLYRCGDISSIKRINPVPRKR